MTITTSINTFITRAGGTIEVPPLSNNLIMNIIKLADGGKYTHEKKMGKVFHQMLNRKQYQHFPRNLDNSIGQHAYFKDDLTEFFYVFNDDGGGYELRSNYINYKMCFIDDCDDMPWWYDDFVEIAMYYDHDVIDMSRPVAEFYK